MSPLEWKHSALAPGSFPSQSPYVLEDSAGSLNISKVLWFLLLSVSCDVDCPFGCQRREITQTLLFWGGAQTWQGSGLTPGTSLRIYAWQCLGTIMDAMPGIGPGSTACKANTIPVAQPYSPRLSVSLLHFAPKICFLVAKRTLLWILNWEWVLWFLMLELFLKFWLISCVEGVVRSHFNNRAFNSVNVCWESDLVGSLIYLRILLLL